MSGSIKKLNGSIAYIASALILAVCVSGCGVFPAKSQSIELPLLTFEHNPQSQLIKQSVTVQYNDRALTFLVLSRISADSLKTIAILPTGQQLYSLEYDGREFQADVSELMKVKPGEIIAMQQFVLWPLESIEQEFGKKSDDWVVKEALPVRELFYADHLVLTATYSTYGVEIRHHLKHYTMLIKSLESQPL